MIPHPGLFNISRYEKRDTEKGVSEMCNCPQYYTGHCAVCCEDRTISIWLGPNVKPLVRINNTQVPACPPLRTINEI